MKRVRPALDRLALKVPRVGRAPGRDLGVDALRGITILLVVLGHAISAAVNLRATSPYTLLYSIHRFVYVFHMPAFFLISGYVLYGRRVRVGDRAVRLLPPFFAWIPLYFLMNHYLFNRTIPFWTVVKNTVLDPRIGLWFLPTLFLCSLLLIPIAFLKQEFRWPEEATLAGIFVVVNLLKWNSLGFMQIKYFFFFFALGYLAAKHRGWIDEIGRKRTNALLLVSSVLFLLGFAVLFNYGKIDPYPFPVSLSWLFSKPLAYLIRYGMALLGVLFLIGVVRALKAPRARTALAWFGLVTMDIYVAHGIMMRLTFGTGVVRLVVSFLSGVFLSLALSFLVLRQTWPTAVVFLGIKPEPGTMFRGKLAMALRRHRARKAPAADADGGRVA
ncbi:MAG: acyltransferase family protein [Actinobacteria bacterium]|nr:acyltransferase family protein [Actinomycetota bacterium]